MYIKILSIFTVLFFMLPICYGQSQLQLSGKLQDAVTKTPLPNISLGCVISNAGSISKKQTISDANGMFLIEVSNTSTVVVAVEAMGYKPYTDTIQVATVKQNNNNDRVLQLPVFYLLPDPKILKEVVVTGKKELLELKSDRIVYNVKLDPMAATNNLQTLLSRQPFFLLSPDGKLTYKGMSFKVYVNGRPSGMARYEPDQFLKFTQGRTIDRIDIITSPSAKYDMDGSDIVIDIITTKVPDGYFVSLGSNLDTWGAWGGDASVMLRTGKWGINASGNYYKNPKKMGGGNSQANDYLNKTYTIGTSNAMDLVSINQRISIAFCYDMDKQNLFNLGGSIIGRKSPSYNLFSSSDTYTTAKDLVRAYTTTMSLQDNSNTYTLDADYLHAFKRDTVKRRESSLSAAYRFNSNPSDNDNSQYTLGTNAFPGNKREQQIDNYEHALQTDYTLSGIGKKRYSFETGLKAIYRYNEQNTATYEQLPNQAVFDDLPQNIGAFTTRQQVYSGYINYNRTYGKKWNISAGMRGEYSNSSYLFSSSNICIPFGTHYFYLMPLATISYMYSPASRFSFRVNTKVQKPTPTALDPIVKYDVGRASYGNPYLNPQRTNSARLDYTFQSNSGLSISSSLDFAMSNNGFEYFSWMGNDSIINRSVFNSANSRSLSLSLGLQQTLFKDKLRLGLTVLPRQSWLYNKFAKTENNNLSAIFSLNASYTVTKSTQVSMSCSYTTETTYFNTTVSALFTNDISISQRLLKNKLAVSAGIFSPFQDRTYRRSTNSGVNTENYYYSYTPQRKIYVNLNYNFGKNSTKQRKNTKKISNDDLRSVN